MGIEVKKLILPEDIWQDTIRQLSLGDGKADQLLCNSEVMEIRGSTWVIGAGEMTAVIRSKETLAQYVSAAAGTDITLEFVPLVPSRATPTRVLSPEAAWKATLGELELQMTRATFNTWLKDAVLIEEHGGLFRIGVRNEYAKDWLENRLDETIKRTLAAIIGRAVTMQYIVVDVDAASTSMPAPNGQWTQGEWEEMQQVVARRQASAPSASLTTPASPHKNGAGGRRKDNGRTPQQEPPATDTPIRYRNIRPPTDPLGSFVKLTHYASRFWRPYLGDQTFALLEVISSFSYEIKVLHKPGPSIKLLAEIMQCDYTQLLGRKAYGDKENGSYRDGKYGWLNRLRDHHICHHHTEGKGRGQVQYFDYLTEVDNLPLLTPKQVGELSPLLQDIHWEWLKLHTAVNLDEWLADERESAIPPIPVSQFTGEGSQ